MAGLPGAAEVEAAAGALAVGVAGDAGRAEGTLLALRRAPPGHCRVVAEELLAGACGGGSGIGAAQALLAARASALAQWGVLPSAERGDILAWALGIPHRLAMSLAAGDQAGAGAGRLGDGRGAAGASVSTLLQPPARALGAALLKRELSSGWETEQGVSVAALPTSVVQGVARDAAASGLRALTEWLRVEAECVQELQPGGGSQALGLPLAAHKAAATAAESSLLPEAWKRSELAALNCLPAAQRGEAAATECLAAAACLAAAVLEWAGEWVPPVWEQGSGSGSLSWLEDSVAHTAHRAMSGQRHGLLSEALEGLLLSLAGARPGGGGGGRPGGRSSGAGRALKPDVMLGAWHCERVASLAGVLGCGGHAGHCAATVPALVLEAERGGGAGEMTRMGEVLLALAYAWPWECWNGAVGRGGKSALELLVALTQGAASAGGARMASIEAREVLLVCMETWGCLLGGSPVNGLCSEAAGAAFSALLEAHLSAAAEEAFDDANEAAGAEEGEQELVQQLAEVGRGQPLHALPALTESLASEIGRLQVLASSGEDPSVCLERATLLVATLAASLADSCDGEVPLLPVALQAMVEEPGLLEEQRVAPLVGASQALLHSVAVFLDPSARRVVSPRFGEVAVRALARWLDTYLFSEEAVPHLAARRLSANIDQAGTLDMAINLAGAALTQWPGEFELHRLACNNLLAALTRRKALCARVVVSPTWGKLVALFQTEYGALLRGLNAKLHRRLVEALCRAAAGIQDNPGVHQYTGQVLGVLESCAADLGREVEAHKQALAQGKPNGGGGSGADMASAVLRASCLLEGVRGACLGMVPRAEIPTWQRVRLLLPGLLEMQSTFRGQPAVTCLLLKLAACIVDTHVAHLQPTDAGDLVLFSMRLLTVYRDLNLGHVAVAASKALRDDGQKGRYRDLCALVKLLSNLLTRELASIGSRSPGMECDVVQAVFLGLDILVPLLSEELLMFPKLAKLYFTLLAYLLEAHTEKVVALPPEAFGVLMRTLHFGLRSADTSVLSDSFEATIAIATFNYKSRLSGGPGLGGNALCLLRKTPEPVLQLFMHLILERLLFGASESASVAGEAAGPLLPLILAEGAVFEAALGQVLQSEQGLERRNMLHKAAQALVGPLRDGSPLSMDRIAKREFRNRLHKFVDEVRGVVCTK